MTANVYGIPNCDSVKKALSSLKANNVDVTFHDFKKNALSADLLDEWISTLGLDKLINRKGTTWRNLSEQDRERANTTESAKALLLEYPTLIKRPVIELKGKWSIGL